MNLPWIAAAGVIGSLAGYFGQAMMQKHTEKTESLEKAGGLEETQSISYTELKRISDTYMNMVSTFVFSTEALYTEMKDVLCRVENLSANTQEQSAAIAGVSEFVDQVNAAVVSFAEHALDMAGIGEKNYILVHEKQLEIEKTVSNFEKVYQQLKYAAESITGLEEKSKQADSLIGSIDRLSDQTNLLALNASIEAARAGDAGKGFAVVANEVKNLSAQTSEIVRSSTSILKDIIRLADEAQVEMKSAVADIESQSKALNSTVKDLTEVEKATHDMSSENKRFYEDVKVMAGTFSDVLGMIADMGKAVDEVAATSGEINLSIDYETKMVNQLSGSLSSLTENNLTLNQVINQAYSHERRKRVIVATSPYEPFIIYNSEKNQVSGLDIDLIQSIYEESEYITEVQIVPWEMSLEMLKKGMADIVPAISYSPDRAAYMHFSDPYRTSSTFAFYCTSNAKTAIRSIQDLKHKRVAVLTGYAYFNAFDTCAEIHKIDCAKEDIMFQKLLKQQADVVIMNVFSGDYYIKSHSLESEISKQPFVYEMKENAETLMGFGQTEHTDEKRLWFNAQLEKKKRDGTLKNLEESYLV